MIDDLMPRLKPEPELDTRHPEEPSIPAGREGAASSGASNVRTLVTRLIGELPNGWWRLVSAALLSITATGATVALMGVSAWLLSYAAERPPVLYLLVAATAVRTFGTSRGVFRYFERLRSHDVALRMQSALRVGVYDRLARTTLLGARRGDLLMRVTADVEAIMDVVVRIALPFASAGVVLIGTVIILATLNAPSAVVLLACSVLAGLGMPLLAQGLSRRADRGLAPARAELAQLVHAVTRSSTDIVAYGRVEDELTAVAAVDARLRKAEARAAWTRGLATGGQHVAMGLAVAAALWFGGQAVASGAMPGRDLAVLALVPLALHEVFGDLTKAAQTMTHASSALRRVVALLMARPVGSGDRVVEQGGVAARSCDSPGETAVGDGRGATDSRAPQSSLPPPPSARNDADASGQRSVSPRPMSQGADGHRSQPPVLGPSAVLRLDGLAIGWPDEPVLVEGIDLALAPGQTVAVTAPSGVGKTTLAATLLGLIPSRGGTLKATPSIGYLAQDAHIFATTVAENVRIGNPHATDDDVRAALALAGLGHLDPERIVGEDGGTLSGGEARRVALARLLVVSPRPALTILDEPTEHLDAETAAKLMDDIWSTTLPDGALLVLTHDPGVVARCDREVRLVPVAG